MRSFIDLDRTFGDQPRELGALLARIDTARGREQLFENQLPELSRSLAEHARVASITASNAIEGIVVSAERAERIAAGSQRYRNRNEREFAGQIAAEGSGPGARWRRLTATPFRDRPEYLHSVLARSASRPTPAELSARIAARGSVEPVESSAHAVRSIRDHGE
jgi:hypothetical protein